jgi:flagellar motor switch protein FliN
LNKLKFEVLGDVRVAVTALVGRTTASIAEILTYIPGTLVPLDTRIDAPVPLLVNGIAIARGDLVATDDGCLALEIGEVMVHDDGYIAR